MMNSADHRVTHSYGRFVAALAIVYRQFGPLAIALRVELRCRSAILYGELVWPDNRGGRTSPRLYAQSSPRSPRTVTLPTQEVQICDSIDVKSDSRWL